MSSAVLLPLRKPLCDMHSQHAYPNALTPSFCVWSLALSHSPCGIVCTGPNHIASPHVPNPEENIHLLTSSPIDLPSKGSPALSLGNTYLQPFPKALYNLSPQFVWHPHSSLA